MTFADRFEHSQDLSEDPDSGGLLEMPLLDHFTELRACLIRALLGIAVAYVLCVVFVNPIWEVVQAPLEQAVAANGGEIVAIGTGDPMVILWMWTPLLAAAYLAAPWVLYQAWSFIAPGLYPKERRWVVPFLLAASGLFIGGGVFAYWVVMPYTLTFLLGIGANVNVRPTISIAAYFPSFVSTLLSVSLMFELPLVIVGLTLLGVMSPGFLLRQARYAVLTIVLVAAVVTPTQDPLTLFVFAGPMILLFFLSVAASYVLVRHREGRSLLPEFKGRTRWIWIGLIVALVATGVVFVVLYFSDLMLAWPN